MALSRGKATTTSSQSCLAEAHDHAFIYNSLCEILERENTETFKEWLEQICVWEACKTQDKKGRPFLGNGPVKNPYESKAPSTPV